MPDFHQPGPADRAAAEAEGAADVVTGHPIDADVDALRRRAEAMGIEGAATLDEDELLARLRTERPSSRHDPEAPGRPRT